LRHLPAAIREAAQHGRAIEVPDRRRRRTPTPAELKELLTLHDGNVAAVARALDRQWNVVWRWVTKHQLVAARDPKPSSPPAASTDWTRRSWSSCSTTDA